MSMHRHRSEYIDIRVGSISMSEYVKNKPMEGILRRIFGSKI